MAQRNRACNSRKSLNPGIGAKKMLRSMGAARMQHAPRQLQHSGGNATSWQPPAC
ncbi:hypothetical protein [Xanthomonas theicola]|uniref:hypothetical protein n=1 Tax=Xanthomonas theicola TaxID=56464 RepID=UPI001304C4DA|nr:hypothetical protein [Xanthomonas theicola]QNH25189.1 hypothetical protein G4Q83_11210 [Xanthomonas theicola]